MREQFNSGFNLLIQAVSQMEAVKSIGKSGGNKLPKSNESDIDIFIYCDKIPAKITRKAVIKSLGDSASSPVISDTESRFWGTVDFVTIDDTEICLMYFTVDKANAEISEILSGKRLAREDEYFYPTGRCASILSMGILFDEDGFISGLKEKLTVYPTTLAENLIDYHIPKINDEEDFKRAVSRKDILFYHSTLESAVDHYLQVLFALNNTFFPSRKRTIEFINKFSIKPDDCADRLLKTVALGADSETLAQSYDLWSALCNDLKQIIHRKV